MVPAHPDLIDNSPFAIVSLASGALPGSEPGERPFTGRHAASGEFPSIRTLAPARGVLDTARARDANRPYGCATSPGIQLVPASGTRAIAAASIVSATRSSGSRFSRCDLPHARASVWASSVKVRR